MLTHKQIRFCEEYVIDCNGTRAALRAGYSIKTSRSQASQLLSKPEVLDYLNVLREEVKKRVTITPEHVIQELSKIAFCSVRDFVDQDNRIFLLRTVPGELSGCIGEVKVKYVRTDKGYEAVTEIKMHNKVAALKALGQCLGMFSRGRATQVLQKAASQPVVTIKQPENEEVVAQETTPETPETQPAEKLAPKQVPVFFSGPAHPQKAYPNPLYVETGCPVLEDG